MRTKFLDYDSRPRPKTDCFCVRCHRDIKPGEHRRFVHLIAGGATILHPADESSYIPDNGDCGSFPVGMGCARKIGLEWTFPAK